MKLRINKLIIHENNKLEFIYCHKTSIDFKYTCIARIYMIDQINFENMDA